MLTLQHYQLLKKSQNVSSSLQAKFPVKGNISGLGGLFPFFEKELRTTNLAQMKTPPKISNDFMKQLRYEEISHHHLNYLVLSNHIIRETCRLAQEEAPLERENYEKLLSILKRTLRSDAAVPYEKEDLYVHFGNTISRVEVKRIISKEGKEKFGKFLGSMHETVDEYKLLLESISPFDVKYHALFRAALFITLLYDRMESIAKN